MAALNAETMGTEPIAPPAASDRARPSAEKAEVSAAMAYAVAESRLSFVYGLISGPVIFILGGVVFLPWSRRRTIVPPRIVLEVASARGPITAWAAVSP